MHARGAELPRGLPSNSTWCEEFLCRTGPNEHSWLGYVMAIMRRHDARAHTDTLKSRTGDADCLTWTQRCGQDLHVQSQRAQEVNDSGFTSRFEMRVLVASRTFGSHGFGSHGFGVGRSATYCEEETNAKPPRAKQRGGLGGAGFRSSPVGTLTSSLRPSASDEAAHLGSVGARSHEARMG